MDTSSGITLTFRIILIISSLLLLSLTIKRIRDEKVKIEDALVWVCLSTLLLVVSVFPVIFDFLAQIAGVYSSTNFVFLFFIFILLILVFSMAMRISHLETKMTDLAQEIALEKLERHEEKERLEEAECDEVALFNELNETAS